MNRHRSNLRLGFRENDQVALEVHFGTERIGGSGNCGPVGGSPDGTDWVMSRGRLVVGGSIIIL